MNWVVTVGSAELSLGAGAVSEIDDALLPLAREGVLLRIVAVLHALSADKEPTPYRRVNETYVTHAPATVRDRLAPVLSADPTTVFLEPWQQLVVLRRAMTVCPSGGGLDIDSPEGQLRYFDACRFAADVSQVSSAPEATEPRVDGWLRVAAGLMPRMWLLNPGNPKAAIARHRIIVEQLPESDPRLRPFAQALVGRLAASVGVSYDEATTLVRMLVFWILNLDLEQVLTRASSFLIDPNTWLRDTTISTTTFESFLGRTARPWDDILPADGIGGPASILSFRDRPMIRFRNGQVAAIMPELLIEKLTWEFFWWATSPEERQQHPWQADYGRLAEAYALDMLGEIARHSRVDFLPNVTWEGGELDAAIWKTRYLALFEASAGILPEAAANNGEPEALRSGLRSKFVASSRNGQTVREAVLQLVRDVEQVHGIPGLPTTGIDVVYPVLVAADRRVRTPGVWVYLESEFRSALSTTLPYTVAPLAVVGLEDLEEIEARCDAGESELRGTPPGILWVLRRWQLASPAPSRWQFLEQVFPVPVRSRRLADSAAAWWQTVPRYFRRANSDSIDSP